MKIRVGFLALSVEAKHLVSLLEDGFPPKDYYAKTTVFGRPVFIIEFLRASIQYGRCEYHIFVPYINKDVINTLTNAVKPPLRQRVFFHSVLEIPELLRQNSVDVLVDPSGDFDRLLLARVRSALKPVPIVTVAHSVGDLGSSFHLELSRQLGGMMSLDTVVAPSYALRVALENRVRDAISTIEYHGLPLSSGKGRFVEIPLGVDVHRFGAISRAEARATLGWDQRKRILYLGRFSPADKADLMPLLEAHKLSLSAAQSDNVLVLAGDGAESPYLRILRRKIDSSQLGNSVEVESNPVSPFGDRKSLLLAAADVFVSPIDNGQETFGLTLLEAMASNTPVIATNVGGYSEIIRHGVDGILIDSYSAESTEDLDLVSPLLGFKEDWFVYSQGTVIDLHALSNAISTVTSNQRFGMDLAQNALSRVRDLYSWESVLIRYEELYNELLSAAQDPAIVHELSVIKSRILVSNRGRILEAFRSPGLDPQRSQVQTTPLGETLLNGEQILSIPEVRDFVPLGGVMEILRKAKTPVSINTLLQDSRASNEYASMAPDNYIIHWLLKHGYLRRIC